MSLTLNGTSPAVLIAVGVANAAVGRISGANELLKTSMLPVPALLAAYSVVLAWFMASPV
jgi:hypothetical protein